MNPAIAGEHSTDATLGTNALGYSKTETHDGVGKILQTIDAAGHATNFAHDAYSNLLTTTDPLGNQINVTYDNLGRKIQLHDPDLGIISYGIDPRGLQYNQQSPNEKANAQFTTFIHDALDRLTQRSEPDLTSNWVYDVPVAQPMSACVTAKSCGKLIEAYSTLLGGAKDYDRVETYDGLGRPDTTTSTLDTTYITTYSYDEFGRPFSTIHQRNGSSGTLSKTLGQVYNQNGYLAEVVRGTGSSAQVIWQSQQQDAANHVLQAGLGNGLTINRIYSPNTERLTTGCVSTGINSSCTTSGAELLQEGYVFDALGNVTTRNQFWSPTLSNANGVLENFTYDALNRLANSQVVSEQPMTSPSTQAMQTFNYDAGGDILNKTGVGTGNYVYPASGSNAVLPHAVASIPGIGSFAYDADGNMTTGNGRTTTWSSFDMPNVITEGSNSSTFVYGPEHQRVIQRRADMTMVYADGMEVDTNVSTGIVTVKTYWPAGLGFDTDTLNSTGASTATTLTWVHADRLGSVIGYTNQSGTLVESLGYDAWGSRRNLNGSGLATGFVDAVDNKGFTSQEMLDQLALVHLNGRIYDPLIGRFMSGDPEVQDPTHSQSFNRYTYVWNNPTNLTDPSGFEATKDQVDAAVASGSFTFGDGKGNLMDVTIAAFDAAGNKMSLTAANLTQFLAGIANVTGNNTGQSSVPGTDKPASSSDKKNSSANTTTYTQSKYDGFENDGTQVAGTTAFKNSDSGGSSRPHLTPDQWMGQWFHFDVAENIEMDLGFSRRNAMMGSFALGMIGNPFGAAERIAAKAIDATAVRFSQDSAKAVFSKGGTIQEMADALRSGALKADQIPAIRLVDKDGVLFTLDNRRLEAFRRAEMNVPYRMATPEEAASEVWKFTTRNEGTSIRIRGE